MTRKRRSPSLTHIAAELRPLAVEISSLNLDPANLRLHGEKSIQAIKASLARFGQQKAIVYDSRGVVIAGNGTLQAARELGWTHIAAAKTDLAGVDRTAFAIADNRIAELSTWDEDALRQIAGELDDQTLEAVGFTRDDLSALNAGASAQANVVQDEPPAPPANPIARLGDLWHMGEHRLLCGDCTKVEDVERLMGGERAILFATDPPYLVGYDGTNHPQSFTGGGNKDWSETYGTTWDENDPNSELYDQFIGLAVSHVLDPRAAWYCWHASRRQAMLEAAWVKHGAFVHCQIIWTKNKPVLTRTWYLWQHEPCLMGWMKSMKPPRIKDAARASTVWNVDTLPNTDERPDHPTPKPVELFAIPIQQHTRKGDLCYEPFSGSGTQIVVAEQLGRRCYALDIQPAYIDVAIERWEKLTGKSATLASDGRTFAEVAQERRRCPPNHPGPATTQAAQPSSRKATARRTRESQGPGPRPKARRPSAGTAQRGGD